MTFEAECPYCEKIQDIELEDFEDGETYEWQCYHCEKYFAGIISISVSSTTNKADCLNGGSHAYKAVYHHPHRWPDWVRCMDCGKQIRGEKKDESLS